MLIILSQKIDTTSEYADEAFKTYHYPARYKNQIHEGDTFVYYQGNRYVKEQRYYFGMGTIGQILTTDGENYYASLINGQRFKCNVPIYLTNEKYVEQLGYENVRKSPTPPWQSSIRPLSKQAFDYIIAESGIDIISKENTSVDELKEQLKAHIRAFYLDNDINAILEIKDASSEIINALSLPGSTQIQEASAYQPVTDCIEKVQTRTE